MRRLEAAPAVPRFRQPYHRYRSVVEIFGGKGALTRHLRAAGLDAYPPIDISNGPDHDMSRASTQDFVISHILATRFSYIHFGTPCTVWSCARRNVADSVKNREKERNGVALAVFTARAIQACSEAGVRWSLENPATSRLWQFPVIASLSQLPNSRYVRFDMCRFGTPYRKPTLILTDVGPIARLVKTCCHAHRHQRLAGGVRMSTD